MANMLTFVTVLAIVFVTVNGAIRVDDKRGFRYCRTPQLAQIESVQVTGCNRWPCFIIPGRTGTFQITFSHNSEIPITNMVSSIYARVSLPVTNLGAGNTRVAMPHETQQPVCHLTTPGCPVYPNTKTTISKTIVVPQQARLVRGPMMVEFQVKDNLGRMVTCFMAPVFTN
ncbi:uncharacterized protein LOC125035242 [Penaeus chinensis]|uniref:uncharacterized protein LOC125035242 n=1 Tax=Penaeus chinensis TaxID=139456 RepID=UPI001FB6E653|nr:uncharacterized protein LOC125035242 [Penaeus chinensis]XP_047483461.1 uncharacterized protein LOC125035242 [Penaeus chinensis]